MFPVSPKPSLIQVKSPQNLITGHLRLLHLHAMAVEADAVMMIGDTLEKSANVDILTLNPAYGSVKLA